MFRIGCHLEEQHVDRQYNLIILHDVVEINDWNKKAPNPNLNRV
jgi:hypothetical protein